MSALLKAALERRVGAPVRLYVTNNRSTMISTTWQRGTLHVRVHRIFTDCDRDTLEAVAAYVSGARGRAARRIDDFLEEKAGVLDTMSRPRRRARLRTEGSHHDLRNIYDNLNGRYFSGSVNAEIGWGRRRRKKARTRIDFGAYYPDTHRIRIHAALDRENVPRYFVEFVVYHEMCHAWLAGTLFGRKGCHTPEFRRLEKRFRAYEKARAWEQTHAESFFR